MNQHTKDSYFYGIQESASDSVYNNIFLSLITDCPKYYTPLLNERAFQQYVTSTSEPDWAYSCFLTILPKYTLDTIFDRNLYILIPFYIFKYQSKLDVIEADSALQNNLKKEWKTIIEQLDALSVSGQITILEQCTILRMSDMVIRHFTYAHPTVQSILCNILDVSSLTYNEKTIYTSGIQTGISSGIKTGLHIGQQNGIRHCTYHAIQTLKKLNIPMQTIRDILEQDWNLSELCNYNDLLRDAM